MSDGGACRTPEFTSRSRKPGGCSRHDCDAVCTLATAAIHVVFAFPTPMFIASGVGYGLLLVAFFLPVLRPIRGLVGAALALFALGNLGAWYVTGARIPLAYADKSLEATLLAALGAYALLARHPEPMPVRVAPGNRR